MCDSDEAYIGDCLERWASGAFDWGHQFDVSSADMLRAVRAVLPPQASVDPVVGSELSTTLAGALAGLDAHEHRVVTVDFSDRGTAVVVPDTPLWVENDAVDTASVVVRNSSRSAHRVSCGQQSCVVLAGESRVVWLGDRWPADPLKVDGRVYSLESARSRQPLGTLTVLGPVSLYWSVRHRDTGRYFFPENHARFDRHGRGWFVARDAHVRALLGEYEVSWWDKSLGWCCEEISLGATGCTVRASRQVLRRDESWPWLTADLHVHRNYSGTFVVGQEEATNIVAASGLDTVVLVLANWANDEIFDATMESAEGCIVGEEFRNDYLGHFVAFGGSRLSQLHSGHSSSSNPGMSPTPLDMAYQARSRGNVVVWSHPFWGDTQRFMDGSLEPGEYASVEARFLPVCALAGLVDAVDLLSPGDTSMAESVAHNLFDLGCRFALTAGSDSFLSFRAGMNSDPLGEMRTYLYPSGSDETAALVGALRARTTFVSSLGYVSIEAVVGEQVLLPGADVCFAERVEMLIRVRGAQPKIEYELVGSGGWRSACLSDDWVRVSVPRSTWLAVRIVREDGYFHSTPYFIEIGGIPIYSSRAVRWAAAWLNALEVLMDAATRERGLGDEPEVFDQIAEASFRLRLKTQQWITLGGIDGELA